MKKWEHLVAGLDAAGKLKVAHKLEITSVKGR